MDEAGNLTVGYGNGQHVLIDAYGSVVAALNPGAMFEVWMGSKWQAVSLYSGGYQGCYYLTDGERGRLAVCMRVRFAEVSICGQQVHDSPLEEVRRLWLGKPAQSKIALAGGYVRGEVREVTERGMVVFVYSPRLNAVPVRMAFPVEQLTEVLVLVA